MMGEEPLQPDERPAPVAEPEIQRRWVIVWMLVVFAADRVAKDWMAQHLVPGQSIVLLPPVLSFTLIENSGAAFGILQHRQWLFVAVAMLVLIAGGYALVRRARFRKQQGIAMGLLMGGAAGNLWDRVVNGRVIDFIHFEHFAIFNLADASIVVGMALLLWDGWHREQHHERR